MADQEKRIMCGIAAVICLARDGSRDRSEAALLHMLGAIRHRGDTFHFAEREVLECAAIGTNRLAIVDRGHAGQPLCDPTSGRRIVMNGEIYNFGELRDDLIECGRDFLTWSDTEVVLKSYAEWGPECINRLDGIFAFVIYDPATHTYFAARDHLGIKPLYFGKRGDDFLFASERKCFIGLTDEVCEVLPGHYIASGRTTRYTAFTAAPVSTYSDVDAASRCRAILHAAVRKQVTTDLPIAVIFSGGLDSTIILHLASQYHPDVTAFSIGTDNSEDLGFARRFCEERGIRHIVTPWRSEQIARNIPRAIFDGELFEPIDISDMLTMSAIYAAVAAEGFKIAVSGDGSDEIFAGYDLFKTSEDPYALSTYRVNNLFRTDLQRTDRSSMSNSIECRVPFLDRDLVEFALGLPMHHKIRDGVEKYVLREAFRTELPAYMINRPKIRMPEGIGVRDEIFQALAFLKTGSYGDKVRFGIDTPQLARSLGVYMDYGFPAPPERCKTERLDYSPGGYFRFSNGVTDEA